MIFTTVARLHDVQRFQSERLDFLKITLNQCSRYYNDPQMVTDNLFVVYVCAETEEVYAALMRVLNRHPLIYAKGFIASIGTIKHFYLTEWKLVGRKTQVYYVPGD